MRKIAIGLLFISFWSFATPAANAVKSSSKQDTKKMITNAMAQSQESVQSILKKINAFSMVEKVEKNPAKLLSIKKTKAGLWLSLAKSIRSGQKDTQITQDESRALAWAIAESKSILKLSNLKKDHSYSYYIKGMAEVDLNQNENAVQSFQKSIELDPSAEWIPIVALYLGEQYFDKEDFEKAIVYYMNYQSKMSSSQKALALYKTAWCYVGRKKWSEAARSLESIIAEATSSEFTKDSLRDLAFVLVQSADEKFIIAKAQDLMNKKQDPEVLFLSSAYNFLQRESKKKGAEVYRVLMDMQKNPIKRVELRLTLLRTWKADYMNLNYLQSFQDLQKEIVDQWKSWPQIQESLGKELEVEFETVLALIAKIHSGKTKPDPSLKSIDISNIYKGLLKTHLEFFQKSQMRPQLVEALLDFCQEKNDMDCVNTTSDQILKDPSLVKLHERAFLIQIDRLQALYDKDSNLKSKYKEHLDQFAKKFPKSSKVLEVRKRLMSFYVKDKMWSEALDLSKSIYAEEKSSDNFFQVQWARFNIGQYKEVMNEPEQEFEKKDKKFMSLRRESALKLASESKIENDEDFVKYDSYIKNFLKLSDDPAKRKQAILHYFESASSKKKYSELIGLYLSLKPELQLDMDIVSWIRKTLVNSYLAFDLDIWNKLFKSSFTSSEARYLTQFQDEFMLYLLVTHDPLIKKYWVQLSSEKKKSLIGHILISDPKLWFQLVGLPQKPTKEDKSLVYLAIQLDQKTTDPQLNVDDKKLLHDILPEDKKIYDEVALEKSLKQLAHKQSKKSKSLKVVKSLMDNVQKTRPEVLKALKIQPAVIRLRILDGAILIEQNMVQLILDSDVPKELDPSQIEEYKQGLVSLAEEFKNQAEEYGKVKNKLAETEKAILAKTSTLSAPPNLEKWKLAQEFQSEAFNKIYNQYGLFYALAYLDMKRARKEMDETQLAWARSWLLIKQNNPALTQYAFDELTAQNQTEILSQWSQKQ